MGAAVRRLAAAGRRALAPLLRLIHRTWARVGPRGSILLALGWIQVTYGYQLITQPRYGIVRGVWVLTSLAPMTFWGGLWVATGVVGVFMSVETKIENDTFGYGAIFVPYALWAAANVYAFVTGSYPQAYTSAVTWGLLAAVTLMINRWLGAARRGGTRGPGGG